MYHWTTGLTLAGLFLSAAPLFGQDMKVGVAQIDITPNYPIRLSGFGFRRLESDGVTQKVWAKALAIQADNDEPVVIITVDNLGVPWYMTQEVARRLGQKANLKPERLAITASHSHTTPMLTNVAPTLFGQPIPKDHQGRIDRYTAELTDHLAKVALAALADRQPAKLSWGVGKVAFAMNRRTKGGPVDHDLPLLVVREPQGKVRAVYVTYACHCVTLAHNKISGDWAGYAQEEMAKEFPGAIALVSVGCGADQNPNTGVTGDKIDKAREQGLAIAREVRRLAQGFLAPVKGKITAGQRMLGLPLADLPTREQWELKAKRLDAVGYHARVNLARLDRQEKLRTKIDYPVQTVAIGDALAMIFLPGEVVVDYSLRLKKELDRMRLWINAYANDDPCYIPSERVLKEGGYEGGGAMIYYDVPVPFRPGLEEKIIGAVKGLLGPKFHSPIDAKKTGDARPLSPQQSLAMLHTKKHLQVQLVAAEPLVVDPVAIDFGPDGKLYVAEMYDYPMGVKGDYQPGGRIKVLEDTDGDGFYDKAAIFLDNIPFPTGVTAWRKGVLVCAAPDILYAEDSNGDGRADVVRKLYSGFGTGNYQARVNSLEWALDGWVHGSCGLFGGSIQCTGPDGTIATVNLGDRDFRIKPDQGLLEPATGRTQQSRVRDDWDNWFGCDNSNLCRHYPLADHYLRRNPHAGSADVSVYVPAYPNPNRLFPRLAGLQVFKLSGPPGHTTAACGLGIYRDELLGKEFRGNAFVCEPVNLVVHRLCMAPTGCTFAGRRADDEHDCEFLSSTDNWFRPVQARTGPDGALWVVDMYRFVIEHPRWIPPEDNARLDLRAGSTLGRIYRIVPRDQPARPLPRLDKLDHQGLIAALDSANGWQRDMASQLLLWGKDRAGTALLERMAIGHPRPETRVHALVVLAGWEQLAPGIVAKALTDKHGGVRRHAIRLAEKHLLAANGERTPLAQPGTPEGGRLPHVELHKNLLKLVDDPDPQVRLQLAYTLGEWRDPQAGTALATLLWRDGGDRHILAAALSSLRPENLPAVLHHAFAKSPSTGAGTLLPRLLSIAAAVGDSTVSDTILQRVTQPEGGQFAPWQMLAAAQVLDSQRTKKLLNAPRLPELFAQAQQLANAAKAAEADRLAAMALLGQDRRPNSPSSAILLDFLAPQVSLNMQMAALTALGKDSRNETAAALADAWKRGTPAVQGKIVDMLLSRPSWQRHLLERIARKDIPTAQIDAARRQRLLNHKEETIRKQAVQLFEAIGTADRQKVLEGYRVVLDMTGSAERGQVVFTKRCAACHRLENQGQEVGPDLTPLATKTPLYLLTEILDPNRNMDSRYVGYLAVTKAGKTHTGILASETATSITLKSQDGKMETLLRRDLEELTSTAKSLMPEGLEQDVPHQDMADLLAYLRRERK